MLNRITLNVTEVLYAALTSDDTGFCVVCGTKSQPVAQDVRRAPCEQCGQPGVFGALAVPFVEIQAALEASDDAGCRRALSDEDRREAADVLEEAAATITRLAPKDIRKSFHERNFAANRVRVLADRLRAGVNPEVLPCPEL